MKAKQKIILGILFSNLFAIVTIAISKYIVNGWFTSPDAGSNSGVFIFSDFVIIPVIMGIIAARFWHSTNIGRWAMFWLTVFNGILAITLSYIFLGEGTICLLIVSPLLFGFLFLGLFIGLRMYRKNNNKLNVSVFSLLFLIFITDSLTQHQYVNKVSDTIIIHATPMQIWKHVVAFDDIKEPPHYWLFRMGMPYPAASTVDGYYLGSGRKCIFSNGYTFDEKISTYKPGENLVFDITNQPRDPEIMGHIDLLRGQFLLKDNGDGTTTLTGNSWYRLYVFPTWYYDFWARSLVRHVHTRVMENIKKLSEENGEI